MQNSSRVCLYKNWTTRDPSNAKRTLLHTTEWKRERERKIRTEKNRWTFVNVVVVVVIYLLDSGAAAIASTRPADDRTLCAANYLQRLSDTHDSVRATDRCMRMAMTTTRARADHLPFTPRVTVRVKQPPGMSACHTSSDLATEGKRKYYIIIKINERVHVWGAGLGLQRWEGRGPGVNSPCTGAFVYMRNIIL